jgi:hypothetical protein
VDGLAALARVQPLKQDKPEGVDAIRSLLIGSARLSVTAGLLWALLARVDLGHIKEVVDHVSLPLLAAGATALLATSPFAKTAVASARNAVAAVARSR